MVGLGGGRLFVKHLGLEEASEQTEVHTEDPLRFSGICRAFTMACICFGAKGIANIPPGLLAAEMPPTMSAVRNI